jgi:hypothetical protein
MRIDIKIYSTRGYLEILNVRSESRERREKRKKSISDNNLSIKKLNALSRMEGNIMRYPMIR